MKAFRYPWRDLPGRPDELAFLERRMEEMSVLECAALEGAVKMGTDINNAADLIDATEHLDRYELFLGALDFTTLGRSVFKCVDRIPDNGMPYLNFEQRGKVFMAQSGGVFTESGFVHMPIGYVKVYNGTNLEDMGSDWSVRLKLASESCPHGVWLCLPDYEIFTGVSHEAAAAMAMLQISDWSQATLLESRCCLANISDLAGQYESVEALVFAGNNLGYALLEHGQGMPFFKERFFSAMELEGCTRLDFALDISRNLDCYDFVPDESEWRRFSEEAAKRDGIAITSDRAFNKYFDPGAYAKFKINTLGLHSCIHGYVARNAHPFFYEYSQPPQAFEQIMT